MWGKEAKTFPCILISSSALIFLYYTHFWVFLSSSPFTTNVEPGVDASRVRLSGAGVQDSIPASLPVTFLIDTREAGIADLEVLIKVRVKVHLTWIRERLSIIMEFPCLHSTPLCKELNITRIESSKPQKSPHMFLMTRKANSDNSC